MMVVGLLGLASLATGLNFKNYDDVLKRANNRPVIGVLTLPANHVDGYTDKSSYIAASYVKHLESAGLRVAPIFYNLDYPEIDSLLEKVNGVFFTGGTADLTYRDEANNLHWSTFMEKVHHIVKKSQEINDRGIYFPLWSTCLGLEILHIAVAEECILEEYDGRNYTTNVFFTDHAPKSRLISNADPRMIHYMRNLNVTYQNHGFGIHPRSFQNNANLKDMFRVLALAMDKQGKMYVDMVEAIKYPFYSVMFHPEKPAFEWSLSSNFPHDIIAVEVGQYFATFFATEARKNSNRFGSYEEWRKHSIYNYKMVYLHEPFEQAYFFE